MTRIGGSFLGIAVLVIVFVGCAKESVPRDAAKADAPPTVTIAPVTPTWQVGDRWVYEWTSGKESGTKTIEVIGTRDSDGTSYYVLRLEDAEHYYTRALHWAAAVREGRVEARMVPPQPWFMWPLAAGAQWGHKGRFEQREGVATHDDRFSVVGPERIEVPAGRYEAVRVLRQTNRRDRDEYWYAPDIRWYARWVGRRGDVEFEERLREYRPVARQN